MTGPAGVTTGSKLVMDRHRLASLERNREQYNTLLVVQASPAAVTLRQAWREHWT